MRIDKVYIENFKNLNKFWIDLDENQMNTVLLGQNATGKSNFIEALVLVFKFLDLSTTSSRDFPDFKYWIQYNCRGNKIEIDYLEKNYTIHVNGVEHNFSNFFSEDGKSRYLPKYVFTYYSGLSDRLDRIFWKHQNLFYKEIIKKNFDKEKLDNLRRLFYVKQIHSFFVLLAFFSLPNMENKSKTFLKTVLGIEDLESVLFILKEPSWKNNKGDARFFGAIGLVQEFLSILWEYSLAPIHHEETVYPDFRSKGVKQQQIYLYLSDKHKLEEFSANYFKVNKETPSNTFLFKALESTYISELLLEVRVRVKKTKDGEVTFKELSEGEQQLLTVIGLLIFTREDESLVLLDEPDTHLNPLWKYDYLHYLKSLVKSKKKLTSKSKSTSDNEEDRTTQIIINTHDPLVIGSMEKSQVRLFGKKINQESSLVQELKSNEKIESLRRRSLNEAIEPDKSPKGMGVAGILTSDMFGLPTILDKETQIKLNRKRYLQGRLMREALSKPEYDEYHQLKADLEKFGFYEEVEDKWFKEYISEMSKVEAFQKVEFSKDEQKLLAEQSKKAAQKILKKIKEEEK
jgi:predicted ATPase